MDNITKTIYKVLSPYLYVGEQFEMYKLDCFERGMILGRDETIMCVVTKSGTISEVETTRVMNTGYDLSAWYVIGMISPDDYIKTMSKIKLVQG